MRIYQGPGGKRKMLGNKHKYAGYQLVFQQVMGPSLDSLGGAQYMITAKDDGSASGYLEVGFLVKKAHAET